MRSPEVAAGRTWLGSYLAYFLVQTLQLGVLMAMAPRFFWWDDSQRQFGPMAWWLGRNLRGGRPPLMDPDLGMAGNLVADLQYGALDPLHWVFQYGVGRLDNFIVISRVYGALSVLLLGAGSLWLLLHYRVRPVFAVTGALGIASSGFFLWFGGSWWPLMWSTAWLPWLWVGLASRRWPGVLVAGLATWAILTSGNPYAVPFALLIVVGQTWEHLRASGSWRAVLDARLAMRIVSCVGGVIVALPALLTTLQIASVMGRDAANAEVGNSGFAVANFLDVVLGGMTLMGQTNTWNGNIARVPAMATLLLALPLLALISWQRALRAPGVLTALVVYLAALVATQLPTTVGVFRFPIRYLVFVQVMIPMLALIAVSAAPNLSRKRIAIAGLVIFSQFTLSGFRSPAFLKWHLVALAVTAATFAAAFGVLSDRKPLPVLASIVAVAGVALSPLVGERLMVAVERRNNQINFLPDEGDRPFRVTGAGYAPGGNVEEYRSRSYAVDRAMTVLARGNFGPDMGWSSGIMAGNGNLIAGLKPGFGSVAVWQSHLDNHWCRLYEGDTCSSPAQLLEKVEGTSESWIDVASTDTILLEKPGDPELRLYLRARWDKRSETDDWIEYGRRTSLPGRVTLARGVTLDPSRWTAGLAYAGQPMETYVVSTGDSAGSLIFRTPYWPGFRATLDGRPHPVTSVDQAVVKIDLRPGLSEAELEIFYEPLGARISLAATATGISVTMASAAALAIHARGRRRDSDSDSDSEVTRTE